MLRLLATAVIGYGLLTTVAFVWLAQHPRGEVLALWSLLVLDVGALALGIAGWSVNRTMALALLLLALSSAVFALLLLGLQGVLDLRLGRNG